MPELLTFSGWSIWINIAIFAVNAAIVWFAGARLARLVDGLATRTGMGHGFAGMLLLGLLERRNQTIFKMGYDSAAMLAVFLGGLVLLYSLSRASA